MEGAETSTDICPVCRVEMEESRTRDFGGAVICVECYGSMDLDSLDISVKDPVLAGSIEGSGLETLSYFTALARDLPSEYGWKILALVNAIGEEMAEEHGRTLLESSTILCGNSVIRNGGPSGVEDTGKLTLLLILGQVIDLSIMRKIVVDKDLQTSNALDEMKLIGEHIKVLFNLLADMDPAGDTTKENILTSCIQTVL